MRKIKMIAFTGILLSLTMCFNVFAMTTDRDNEGTIVAQPATEQKHEDRKLNYYWSWLNDEMCVQFQTGESADKAWLQEKRDRGLLSRWIEFVDGKWRVKTRDTYTGKWSQSENGVWSFLFDDYTIPVGVTKIDDVMYAFNGYGELMEGYEYYDGLTTGSDGLVTSEDPAFLEWLETQYVPECFTHQEKP